MLRDNFESIPLNVFIQIFCLLTPHELLAVALSNKWFSHLIFQKNNNLIWQVKFTSDYPKIATNLRPSDLNYGTINWQLAYESQISKESNLSILNKLVAQHEWNILSICEMKFEEVLTQENLFAPMITSKNPKLIMKLQSLIWDFYQKPEKNEIDINKLDINGNNFLHWQACFDELIDPSKKLTIAAIIALGVDVNKKNYHGYAPLHFAAKYSANEAAKNLLDAEKVDIDLTIDSTPETNFSPYNALFLAVLKSNKLLVEIILEKKPNLKLKICNDEITILHQAAMIGDVEIFNMLLVAGADIRVLSLTKKNVLYFATLDNQYKMIAFLLEKNVPMQIINRNHIILIAARNNDANSVKLMLAKANEKNEQYISIEIKNRALHEASSTGAIDSMEVLLDAGAEINSIDDENTALHQVLIQKKYLAAKFLIEKGADFLCAYSKQISALTLAVMQDQSELVELMLQKSTNISEKVKNDLLILALDLNESAVLELLLKYFQIDCNSEQGAKLLFMAADKSEKIISLLLKLGADTQLNFALIRKLDSYIAKCEQAAKQRYANNSAVLFNTSNNIDTNSIEQAQQLKRKLGGEDIVLSKIFVESLNPELMEIYNESRIDGVNKESQVKLHVRN